MIDDDHDIRKGPGDGVPTYQLSECWTLSLFLQLIEDKSEKKKQRDEQSNLQEIPFRCTQLWK